MSDNEKLAGELSPMLLDIYKAQLAEMKSSGEINVSLLREVREFLRMHHIELDAHSANMQDLETDANELAAYRKRRSGAA